MEMRSPLSRVSGLGSATEGGVGHWWAQRLTAIALVPLTLWFVASAIFMVGADLATFKEWVGSHGNPVILIVLTIALYHHLQLGMQVVIEDYVHHEGAKTVLLVGLALGSFALGMAAVFAVLKLAFGS